MGECPTEDDNIPQDNNASDANNETSEKEITSDPPKVEPEESSESPDQFPLDSPEEPKVFTPTKTMKSPRKSVSPRSTTSSYRGEFTMYERSMRQKEERERKLKSLQQTLMADFTFTPTRVNSGSRTRNRTGSGDSVVSSLADSQSMAGGASYGAGSVFSRLYGAGTAASRAQQKRVQSNNSGRSSFGSGRSYHSVTGSRSIATTQTASPRLESLFKAGEEKLRARHLSDNDEAVQVKRRIENEALKLPGVYTFKPQTKWDLVAQRRKLAREAKELEEDEARWAKPKIEKEVSSIFRRGFRKLNAFYILEHFYSNLEQRCKRLLFIVDFRTKMKNDELAKNPRKKRNALSSPG